MRKVIAGIAALAVVGGGAAAIAYAPSDSKPSVNSIAAATADTGGSEVYVALGSLATAVTPDNTANVSYAPKGIPTDMRDIGVPTVATYKQVLDYSVGQENTTT